MTQPTHDEVIAWIDEEYRMSEWWDKRREKDGLCDEEDGYRASLLANRDVLERQPEVWVNGTDAGYYGMVGRNQMLIELQAGILQRIAEVM